MTLHGMVRDVTERKQPEEALMEERHLLHTLLDNLPDGIYFKDRESRFTQVNLSLASAFGLNHPSQAVGKTDFDFYTAEHAELAYRDEQEIVRTGQPIVGKEERETWPDGSVTWVSTTKMALRDASGKIIGTFGVSRDITQSKRSEEALREGEEKYRSLVSNIPDVAWTVDDKLRFAFIGDNIEKLSGYSRAEVYEKGAQIYLDSLHPDDVQKVREGFRALLAKGQPFDVECRLRRNDGEWIWIHDRAIASYEKNGIRYADGLISDITERKHREQQTRLQTAALESAANGIVITDCGGRIIWANPAFTHLTGYSAAEVIGENPRLLKSGVQDKASYQKLWNTILSGEVWQGELVNRRKDGTLYAEEMTITPVRDAAGMISHFIAIKQDITTRKRVNAQLATQARIAEIFLAVRDDETYQAILKLVLDEMHSALGLFGFIDEDRGLEVPSMTREIWHMCQMPGKTSRFPRETWGESSWARALKGKRTICSNQASPGTPQGHINIHRHISLPILYRREVLGLFVVANKETDYTENDLRSLEDIASYVAPILSARLHRRRAEASRDFLASIVESSGDAILGVRFDGVIQSCNAGAEKLFGYKAPEVIGQSGISLILPERRKEFEDLIERAKRGEVVEPQEAVMVAKGGGRIDVSVTLSPLKKANGEVVGASAVARDVTARKRAEQDLLFKTALLEAQSESTLDGILVVDITGQVLLVNRQFARMWSFPEETIRTKDDSTLIEHVRGQVKDPEAFLERVRGLYAHTTEESRDEIELKSGRVFERHSSPLRASTGKLYGRIWYFRDITERRELERMKGELVSVVSHELRTPLTSIRGALGLLAGGLLRSQPEKGERMLEIAVSNTDRLVRLINDILDLERMESGKMSVEKQTCNAAELMTQAVDNVRELAEKAGVTLSVTTQSVRLWVDPDRILQAFVNLLSNAIKFSPQGRKIWFSAASQADAIRFEVKDNGRGIPQEKQESIFERFQQVDASDRREKGGTGLGLPITRSIAQQHGGRVWVQSTMGQGSTFFFALPLTPTEAKLVVDNSGGKSVLGKANEGPRVLVVEDDPDLARVLTTVFERHGAVVVNARTGQEAVEVCPQFVPDILVLDVMLPDLDGFGVVEQLRRQERFHHLPVAVYSVKELDDAERARLRLGESIFMTKSRLTPQEFEERAIGLLNWAKSGCKEWWLR